MRGHVERRGKDSYRIKVYRGLDGQGEKDYYYEPFHGSKRAAQARALEVAHQINKKTFVPPAKITVAEHIQRWLEYNRPPQIRQATWEMYEQLSRNYIVPALGTTPLGKLSTRQILDFLAAVKNGPRKDGRPGRLSSYTVKHVYDVLRIALAAAVKWELLPRNPVDPVDPPTVQEREMVLWTPEQAQAFVAAIQGDKYYAAYLLAINCGLRRGEILGLRWQDIDPERRIIIIAQQVVQNQGGDRLQKELKTKRSRRAVAISQEIVDALRERWVQVNREAADYEELYGQGSYANLGLVFCNEQGHPVDPKAFSRRFKRLITRLGLPPIRFHDTRHLSATLMVQAGAHVRVLAERLGDRVETAMNRYAHVLPTQQQEVADRVDEILGLSPGPGFPKDSHSR